MVPQANGSDGFVYNYYNAAWALVQGLNKSNGAGGRPAPGARAEDDPAGYQVSDDGCSSSTAAARRSRTSTPCRSSRTPDGAPARNVVGYVPNVDQTFGGTFRPDQASARTQLPALREAEAAVAGKDQVVKNGVITKQVIK